MKATKDCGFYSWTLNDDLFLYQLGIKKNIGAPGETFYRYNVQTHTLQTDGDHFQTLLMT